MKTNQSQESFDVVINGGGMVGLSLAIALARAQMRVAIIEKTPMSAQLEPSFDGRVSAVAYGSKRMLDGIGAWADMAGVAEPICDIRVSDGDTPFSLHFDHHEVGNEPFGYIVENRHIRHALHNAAKQLPTLTIMDNSMLESFERDDTGVTTLLRGGKILRSSLLVGAEGRQSSVRSQAGIGVTEWKYKQTAIVCTIHHTEPHHGLAQERFLPAGPFAVLPMTRLENGLYRSSLVWVEPDDRVQLYLELPDEELVQEISERVGDYLGEISVSGQRFCYPLSLMHAKSYISERLALIGDAAHGMHPIAGQGVNLGFRDVGVLSQLLIERFEAGFDIANQEVLVHYQRWRRFDTVAMLAATDGLNRLFCNPLVPVKLLRGVGLWTVGKIPKLKDFFMRDAMGMLGDLPKIIKENN
jgi:2-octaprenyl-6-methoxyphenol hydroxylase